MLRPVTDHDLDALREEILMLSMPPLVLLIVGLVLLVAGAEALVRGASRLAIAAGISRLVVGLVIVSLGTSAPEVAIGVGAAAQGNGDLALGNVVGSNIMNTLFILGVTALVAPLIVRERLVRLDIPVMIGVSVLLIALAADARLGVLDAVLLLALTVAYLVMNLRLGRKESAEDAGDVGDDATPSGVKGIMTAVVVAVIGLVVLIVGARLAVDGASELARALGASELVIGLTVVAIGTSLPEVATAVLAALRGERDIAVGNIVGSNILNITLILGLAAGVAPGGLGVARGAFTFDLPVMAATAVAVLPVAFTRQVIARWEGALFLAFYAAYLTHLVLTATVHPVVDELAFAVAWFAFPLTLIVLGAAVVRELKRRNARGVDAAP